MTARQLGLGIALVGACAGVAPAEVVDPPRAQPLEEPRNVTLEFRLGGYKPLIDREASLTGKPYDQIFGASSMLLFEGEVDKILWQKFGTVALGFSIGYAEKYAKALISPGSPGAGTPAGESTSLKVIPARLLAVYRFDYPAQRFGIPLVPYGKAGLVGIGWWTAKGGRLEFADGNRGAGVKYGYSFSGGLSLMLDFLEPRMAKDFFTDVGVRHSYLFGEYVYENVNNFGKAGLDLSGRYWMFGFAMDF
jgi:hypothetical protein